MNKYLSIIVGFIIILELVMILKICFPNSFYMIQLDESLGYSLVLIFLLGGFVAGALKVGTTKGALAGFVSGLLGAIGLIGVYTPEVVGRISLQIESLLLAPLYGLIYGIMFVLRTTLRNNAIFNTHSCLYFMFRRIGWRSFELRG